MQQTAILFPVIVLAAWTFIILLLLAFRRCKALFKHQVTTADFRVGESANVPVELCLVNRNLINLLEMPILFYVIALALLVTAQVNSTALWLAWTYVALRVLHSLVHLSYNHVLHRLVIFTIGNFVLSGLWLLLFLALLH